MRNSVILFILLVLATLRVHSQIEIFKDDKFKKSKSNSDSIFINEPAHQYQEIARIKEYLKKDYFTKLTKVFPKECEFTFCNFINPASINHCLFKRSIFFQNTKFHCSIEFENCLMSNMSIMDTVICDSLFSLTECKFTGPSFFQNSTFYKLIFTGVNANSINLEQSSISEDFIVQNSNINDFLIISDTVHKAAIFFNDTIQNLDIIATRYADLLKMENCVFKENYKFNLSNSVLPKTICLIDNENLNHLDFTQANYEDEMYYDSARNNYKKHQLFIYKTDISKIKLDYRYFQLVFVDPETGQKLSNDDITGVYETLLKNFKDRGASQSYQLLDIEYQDFRWKKAGFGFMSCINHIWWNYGYNKEYVFGWAIGLVLLFTTINFFFLNFLNYQVYRVDNLVIPVKKHFLSRLWYSYIYTSTIFFRLTLKIEKIEFKKKLASLYIMLIYTLGLVCLAYMANFVIQK